MNRRLPLNRMLSARTAVFVAIVAAIAGWGIVLGVIYVGHFATTYVAGWANGSRLNDVAPAGGGSR